MSLGNSVADFHYNENIFDYYYEKWNYTYNEVPSTSRNKELTGIPNAFAIKFIFERLIE